MVTILVQMMMKVWWVQVECRVVPRSVWEAVEVGLTGGGADQNCAFDNDRDGQYGGDDKIQASWVASVPSTWPSQWWSSWQVYIDIEIAVFIVYAQGASKQHQGKRCQQVDVTIIIII